jgi:hypothetical protein
MVHKYPTTKQLIDYFRRHSGIDVYITDLELALNRKDQKNIRTGVARLIANSILPGLEARRRGGPWYYIPQNGKVEVPKQREPETKSIPPMYQEVGKSMAGVTIVSGEDDVLYRLLPLE